MFRPGEPRRRPTGGWSGCCRRPTGCPPPSVHRAAPCPRARSPAASPMRAIRPRHWSFSATAKQRSGELRAARGNARLPPVPVAGHQRVVEGVGPVLQLEVGAVGRGAARRVDPGARRPARARPHQRRVQRAVGIDGEARHSAVEHRDGPRLERRRAPTAPPGRRRSRRRRGPRRRRPPRRRAPIPRRRAPAARARRAGRRPAPTRRPAARRAAPTPWPRRCCTAGA